MRRAAVLALMAGTALVAQPPAGTKPAGGPSYKDLKYPPLRPVRLPQLNASTLPNGMRLFLLEDRTLPMVSGVALVRTGTLLDPPDKAGLANLAVTVMRSGGAGKDSGEQMDDRLAEDGGAVETSVSATSASVAFSALKDSALDVLAAVRDVLTAPRFGQESIDLARTQMRNAVAQSNEDAGQIAHREFSDILYGRDNPYGREPQSTTIGKLQRSDLTAFHARYFFPRNTILAIRGDFDAAAMKEQVGLLFANWAVEQPAPPSFPRVAASPAEASGIYVAARKNVSQTSFAMGQLGGMVNDPDYAALTVMAGILGGANRGRIAQRLSGRAANAAAVAANWDGGYDYPGLFEISGTVPSSGAVDVIKAIGEEVARIRSSEVTDEELRIARENAVDSLVFALDTQGKIMRRLMAYEYYGYPADFLDRYQAALASVTRADVLRVARERLQPEAFTTVVVGDPADYMPPLESLGKPVHKIDLSIPEPKMETFHSDAGSAAKGKALLARLQKAAGGIDRLAAVKDCTTVADYQVTVGGKVTPIRHTERWMSPGNYREDNDLGGGTISAYFDGSFGWVTVPGGSVALTGPALKQVEGNAFRQYVLLLQGGKFPDGTVNAVDDLTLEISGGVGQTARLELDPETSLPVRIRYEAAVPNGPPVLTEEIWADFREVGGIRFPFRITIFQGGKRYADVTVSDFRVNSGLKLSDLDKRP